MSGPTLEHLYYQPHPGTRPGACRPPLRSRALGINAVPTVWLLDKKGNVRTLDPLDGPEELLQQLQR